MASGIGNAASTGRRHGRIPTRQHKAKPDLLTERRPDRVDCAPRERECQVVERAPETASPLRCALTLSDYETKSSERLIYVVDMREKCENGTSKRVMASYGREAK